MNDILLSISGNDRAGIVRDVSESLLHLGANIEDSSMTVLKGQFTMMLIVTLTNAVKLSDLKAALADLEQRTGLVAQSRPLTADESNLHSPHPDCVVTVSAADKPGIVHAVAACLSEMSISIVDLSTHLSAEDENAPVYMMALEVAAGEQVESMRQRLTDMAPTLAVDIEVHELGSDIL